MAITTTITPSKNINFNKFVEEIVGLDSSATIKRNGTRIVIISNVVDQAAVDAVVSAHDHTALSSIDAIVAEIQSERTAVKQARATLQTFVDTPNQDITTADVVQVVKLLCRYVLYSTRW